MDRCLKDDDAAIDGPLPLDCFAITYERMRSVDALRGVLPATAALADEDNWHYPW